MGNAKKAIKGTVTGIAKPEPAAKPKYPEYDLEKRQTSMLTSSIEVAMGFLEQLVATLRERNKRMKIAPAELRLLSVILMEYGPDKGWSQPELEALAGDLVGGGGGSGDGKDIGTLPH